MKKLLATAAVAALMTPFAAMAESEDSLSIQMAATVEDVCTVAFDDDVTSNTLTGSGANLGAGGTNGVVTTGLGDTATVDFATEILNSDDPLQDTIGDITDVQILITAELFCNGDYNASIDAANGLFQNTEGVVNTADFSNQLAYDVNVTFDTDSAASNPALTPFDSLLDPTLNVAGSQHRGQILIEINTGQDDVVSGGARSAAHNLIAGLYTEAMTLSFVMDGAIPAVSFDTAAPAAQTANP